MLPEGQREVEVGRRNGAAARILIVDDEAPMRRIIARTLISAEYGIAEAATVEEARIELARGDFDLVLCDVILAGESGLTLLEEIEATSGETAVLMVTGNDDPLIAHRAAVLGANGYLVKPFSPNELLINVDQALHDSRLREGSADADAEREEARVREVREAILRLEQETRSADEQAADLLGPLSEAVGRRDLETGGHIRRIGESAALLAKANGMSPDEVEAIRLAAPMHDVGKVAIPDSILLKRGALDSSERRLVERHAEIGHDILAGSRSPLIQLAAEIAMTHQEKMDGSGYPQGLAGNDIPLAGRIVAVADVYDALTSDRPYRAALPVDEAVGIMVAGRGVHFDAKLLDLFLVHLDEVRALADDFTDTPSEAPVNGA